MLGKSSSTIQSWSNLQNRFLSTNHNTVYLDDFPNCSYWKMEVDTFDFCRDKQLREFVKHNSRVQIADGIWKKVTSIYKANETFSSNRTRFKRGTENQKCSFWVSHPLLPSKQNYFWCECDQFCDESIVLHLLKMNTEKCCGKWAEGILNKFSWRASYAFR